MLETANVGFRIAPRARKSVVIFLPSIFTHGFVEDSPARRENHFVQYLCDTFGYGIS